MFYGVQLGTLAAPESTVIHDPSILQFLGPTCDLGL